MDRYCFFPGGYQHFYKEMAEEKKKKHDLKIILFYLAEKQVFFLFYFKHQRRDISVGHSYSSDIHIYILVR